MLLAIDGLHWDDESTLLAFSQLARELVDAALATTAIRPGSVRQRQPMCGIPSGAQLSSRGMRCA